MENVRLHVASIYGGTQLRSPVEDGLKKRSFSTNSARAKSRHQNAHLFREILAICVLDFLGHVTAIAILHNHAQVVFHNEMLNVLDDKVGV